VKRLDLTNDEKWKETSDKAKAVYAKMAQTEKGKMAQQMGLLKPKVALSKEEIKVE
jgi:hypothetical protein